MTLQGGTRGVAFLHSPLLKLSSGVRSNNLMHGVDWLPTFMAAIGMALYILIFPPQNAPKNSPKINMEP